MGKALVPLGLTLFGHLGHPTLQSTVAFLKVIASELFLTLLNKFSEDLKGLQAILYYFRPNSYK